MAGDGTKWAPIQQKARRKPGRALRFAGVKPGDQLMLKPLENWYRKVPLYYIVTDRWFDPVAGQIDPVAGEMVGYRQVGEDGEPRSLKSATTLRGLASQQFLYADIDYIALCKARAAEAKDGKVIGIRHGQTIRRRPKIPGL